MTFRPVRRDLDEEPDPEFDPAPVCRCNGDKWVRVPPSYAERMHPYPKPLPLDATDEQRALHEHEARSAAALRADALESYHPCQACMPEQFLKWAQGGYHNGGRG